MVYSCRSSSIETFPPEKEARDVIVCGGEGVVLFVFGLKYDVLSP